MSDNKETTTMYGQGLEAHYPQLKREGACVALAHLDGDDSAEAHLKADEILLRFLEETGSAEVAEAYREARKANTFWYE